MMQEKPLLTLAICCYNFERFIHEAIEAAFAQTYRPLEIVVSDDCSPDGSWNKIVQTIKKIYPHICVDSNISEQRFSIADGLTLVLNKNVKNLGLARHENRLFELSSGEWIAFQSGDDVSAPNRIEEIAKIVHEKPNTRALYSDIELKYVDVSKSDTINRETTTLKQQRSNHCSLPYFLGASAVYHRDVYAVFGPLGVNIVNEDQVLPLRAALLGKIVKINLPLVLYRKHTTNLSGSGLVRDPIKAAWYRLKLIFARYQSLADLHVAEINALSSSDIIKNYQKLLDADILFQRFMAKRTLEQWSLMQTLVKLVLSPRLICVMLLRGIRNVF